MESREDVLKRIVGLERFESQVMFYDDALQAMTEYAQPLHDRIKELEKELNTLENQHLECTNKWDSVIKELEKEVERLKLDVSRLAARAC